MVSRSCYILSPSANTLWDSYGSDLYLICCKEGEMLFRPLQSTRAPYKAFRFVNLGPRRF